jgi:hypothetical protein
MILPLSPSDTERRVRLKYVLLVVRLSPSALYLGGCNVTHHLVTVETLQPQCPECPLANIQCPFTVSRIRIIRILTESFRAYGRQGAEPHFSPRDSPTWLRGLSPVPQSSATSTCPRFGRRRATRPKLHILRATGSRFVTFRELSRRLCAPPSRIQDVQEGIPIDSRRYLDRRR